MYLKYIVVIMTNTYFTQNDNFDSIIFKALPKEKIKFIKPITTGWTNIVFEVSTLNGNYFFRFPRDDFWSRTIVKDYEFSKFIFGKTSFNTVKLYLMYDNNRPFSIHHKIEGNVLADKMNNLSPLEVSRISNDISKFMFELHNIKYTANDIFTVNNIGLNLTDFLNELLDLHVSTSDKVFWKYEEFSKKENNCLVHGDLNSSNVLLDGNNNVSAIIDFGFAGFGNKYFDISRIIGRCPKNFKTEITQSYQFYSNATLDSNILNNEIKIWTDIDNGYINYMNSIFSA